MLQECVIYQHQLNSVRSVMRRLGAQKSTTNPQNCLASACTDKLRVLGENLLDLMLYLAYDVTTLPKVIENHRLKLARAICFLT